MKRNNLPLGDIVLINQYGKILELDRRKLMGGQFVKKIKGFLK